MEGIKITVHSKASASKKEVAYKATIEHKPLKKQDTHIKITENVLKLSLTNIYQAFLSFFSNF